MGYGIGGRRTFGLLTASTTTSTSHCPYEPQRGPYAPLRVYEAVLTLPDIKPPKERAPSNGWTEKVALITEAGV